MSKECSGSPATAKPLDIWIGKRVAAMRTARGHTAQELARILELGVDEYRLLESGAVRIAANQLLEISRALDCPFETFFKDLELCGSAEPLRSDQTPEHVKSQLERLSRIFTMITNDEEREYLIRLAAGFATQAETRERHH
jgi:transcriptional regulator with XRE-family HTH domain